MPAPAHRPAPLRRALPPALALAALLCLTGCFTFETLLKVQRDGSGTLEQTFVLSGPMLQMMTMFAGEDGEAPDLCDEDELRQQAADMGQGVRLTSVEPVEGEERAGCRAFYRFDDVSALRISQDPGDRLPDAMNEAAAQDEPPEYLTFDFTPGATATLVVHVPQNFDNAGMRDPNEAPADSSQRALQLQMMREMLKGARLRIALDVEGAIKETNATYREGSRVTLVDVNFDELLKDEKQLERLMDADPKSPDEVKALLKDVRGIRMEMQDPVRLRFN